MHNPCPTTTNQHQERYFARLRQYFSKQIKQYKCRLLSTSKVYPISKVSPNKVSNLPPQILEEDIKKIQHNIEDIKHNIDELKLSASKRISQMGCQQSGSTLCSNPSLKGSVHIPPVYDHQNVKNMRRNSPIQGQLLCYPPGPHKPLVSERRTPEVHIPPVYDLQNMLRDPPGQSPVGYSFHSTEPSWKAPACHGLENSPRIIPEYYMTTNLKNGILKIDYYEMIIDDIRNLRPLSPYQMKYIRKNLTPHEYYNIIHEYNKVMYFYIDVYLQT